MVNRTILVRAEWDPHARVYVATSEDVPGLVAEAATVTELTEKLESLVPELLEVNARSEGDCLFENLERRWADVPMVVLAEQVTKVRVCA
jgi:predicted RNase H-like HicB family nuclease